MILHGLTNPKFKLLQSSGIIDEVYEIKHQRVALNVTCIKHLYLEVNLLNLALNEDYFIILEVYKVPRGRSVYLEVNPLNPELNPICYLLALLAHHFLHVSRIRVK